MYRATTKEDHTEHRRQTAQNAGNVILRWLIPRVQYTRGARRKLCIRMQESRDGLTLNHCLRDSLILNGWPPEWFNVKPICRDSLTLNYRPFCTQNLHLASPIENKEDLIFSKEIKDLHDEVNSSDNLLILLYYMYV